MTKHVPPLQGEALAEDANALLNQVLHARNRYKYKNETGLIGIYEGILVRTERPDSTSSEWYHDKGIKMHPEWRDDFWEFVDWIETNIGKRPGTALEWTLDRIDAGLGYEPGNLQWLTPEAQRLKQEGRVHLIEYDNRVMTTREWSTVTGLPAKIIKDRITTGWTPKRALETPIRVRKCANVSRRKPDSELARNRRSPKALARRKAKADAEYARYREMWAARIGGQS